MKRRTLHTLAALVALSLGSINLTQAQNLSLTAVTSLSIAGTLGGVDGVVMSINGIPTSGLILGTTTYTAGTANPSAPNNFSYYADDFSLTTSAISDSQTYIQTLFSQPITQVFLFEKSGNDGGTLEALDSSGNVIGNSISYAPHPTAYWTDTGYRGDSLNPQEAWDLAITSDTPIYGVRFVNGSGYGIDPISVMAVAPIPEPAAVGLLGFGMLMLLGRKR